jgi:ATP-binding cassette subfamily F protein 3
MITIRNLTLRRGTKVVLQNASATLNPGEKVGLIGRNGAGKSSLFALLAGRLHADAGEVDLPARWRLAEVAQSLPESDQGATEFVLEGDTRLMAAQAALAAAEAGDDGHAMAEAHHELAEAGAFDARPRAQALLMGGGVRSEQLDAPGNSVSGGWGMRLQLARALMCPADLMLLDEPTNHLDLDALVWLEAWLQRYAGTLILISHDREFLDAVTKVTLHLEDAQLTRYGGNYSAFEELRAERLSQAAAAYDKQQERIAHLQRFIDRFKAKATKAKQAQSRVKALERMEKIAPVLADAEFTFEFKEPQNLPNPMLAFADVDCGYRVPPVAAHGDTPREGADASWPGAGVSAPLVAASDARTIVAGIDRSVLAGQRIGILGANGQGKSTFVKTVAGVLPVLSGTITQGKGLAIGYFAQQELDVLSPADGPLMHMVRLARDVGPTAREQELRDFLGSFRFTGEMVSQPVGTLSGGEKARLVLAMLVWQRPNLLLLDEPTNHLDLTTREALSMALNEFEGTVMLVSHDRALLREVCDEFWLVADGALQPFDGDLDDYQRWLLERSRAAAREASNGDRRASTGTHGNRRAAAETPARDGKEARAPSPAGSRATAAVSAPEARKAAAAERRQQADALRPLRRELNQVDNRLGVLFAERDAIEASFATALAPEALADGGRRLKLIAEEIERMEGRWLELSTQIDELASATS